VKAETAARLAAAVFLAAALLAGCEAVAAGAVPPVKGTIVDFTMIIRTSLPSQYENTLLLENNEPVALLLDFQAPRLAGCEQRLHWRCDYGRLERAESELRNRFFPPATATVTTIEAELGFYPRRDGQTLPTPLLTNKAALHVISPSPGSLLQAGEMDGCRIGDYLDPTDLLIRRKYNLDGSYAVLHPERFLTPRAFYLVDDASRNLRISRHFRLGDFALDYPWFSLGKRQYMALDYGLVRKLEELVDEMNRAGLPGDKIRLIYGFRPPAFSIERNIQEGDQSLKAPFSLHLYGKAVDFILDADGDLRLDDLDHDGQITVRDTLPLIRCVNSLDRRYRVKGSPLFGGAGVAAHHDFPERRVQSPYVHVDTGGFLDEKGNLIRWPEKWPDTGERIDWDRL
jgi:hypothetical protein